MTLDHLAAEAERLGKDETLNMALDALRLEALNELAGADADNKTLVLRLQQKVAVIDDIRSELKGMVLRGSKTANSSRTFA